MKIKLINGNLGKVGIIDTDAETWGELQGNSQVQDFMSGDTQAVIRETQNTLDADQAQLPTGKLTDEDKDFDYSLFFITKKSKAGTEDYSSWSFSQLRAECASRDSIEGNGGNYGSTEAMIALLEEDDAQVQTISDDTSQLDRIEEKLDFVVNAIRGEVENEAAQPDIDADEQEEYDRLSRELA